MLADPEPVKLSISIKISDIPTVSCGFSVGGLATLAETASVKEYIGLADIRDKYEKSSSSPHSANGCSENA
jgi:hypothetical protein